MARELGGIVAREARSAGDGAALVTGGGPGVMAAANRGAFEAGGVSVGMNILLPAPQAANAWITPGLGFSFRYFALRKLHFMLRARALQDDIVRAARMAAADAVALFATLGGVTLTAPVLHPQKVIGIGLHAHANMLVRVAWVDKQRRQAARGERAAGARVRARAGGEACRASGGGRRERRLFRERENELVPRGQLRLCAL